MQNKLNKQLDYVEKVKEDIRNDADRSVSATSC
jgi:hypothetical protein